MTPRFRKWMLIAHITMSVGWMGAVVPYLTLALTGLFSKDVALERAAYRFMALIGWYVLVPLSLATVITGLVQSLGTPWGLVRHWWVLTKFLLTLVATAVLLRHMQLVGHVAQTAAGKTLPSTDFQMTRLQLVIHPVGGLLVLLAVTALSVFKPWGMTPYGRRNPSQTNMRPYQRSQPLFPAGRMPVYKTLHWPQVVGMHIIGIALLLVVILHLARGGIWMH